MTECPQLQRILACDELARTLANGNSVELSRCRLPFYDEHTLLCLHIWASHHFYDLAYLDNGSKIYTRLGDQATIQAINMLEDMDLCGEEVAWYVRFVMSTQFQDRCTLVEKPEDMVWQPLAETDPEWKADKAQAVEHIHPLQVTDGKQCYEGLASVYANGMLLDLDIHVCRDGRFELGRRRVLMQEIPGVALKKPLRVIFRETCEVIFHDRVDKPSPDSSA